MRKILAPALLATIFVLSAWLFFAVQAQAAPPAQQASQPVTIYFFWGDGCPHCAAAKPFLAELSQRYPSVTI
ncbi:MAG: thioredoxin family protein, partial [Caldilineaceae bacterium]|nr:thioredoxin family protein [Caldilineaceae bacterium]